jgi:hypothetical protein
MYRILFCIILMYSTLFNSITTHLNFFIKDVVVYWYRPFLKDAVPSEDSLGPPYVANQDTSPSSYTPQEVLLDNVYVLTILTSPGIIYFNFILFIFCKLIILLGVIVVDSGGTSST